MSGNVWRDIVFGRDGGDDPEHWYTYEEEEEQQHLQGLDGFGDKNVRRRTPLIARNERSERLAGEMREASNSIYEVIGVVRRSHPTPLHLETATSMLSAVQPTTERSLNLQPQNSFLGGTLGLRDAPFRKNCSLVMARLTACLLKSLRYRLIAYPARSCLSIVDQAMADYHAMSCFNFFLAGFGPLWEVQLLERMIAEFSVAYLPRRIIIATISDLEARAYLMNAVSVLDLWLPKLLVSHLIVQPFYNQYNLEALGAVTVTWKSIFPNPLSPAYYRALPARMSSTNHLGLELALWIAPETSFRVSGYLLSKNRLASIAAGLGFRPFSSEQTELVSNSEISLTNIDPLEGNNRIKQNPMRLLLQLFARVDKYLHENPRLEDAIFQVSKVVLENTLIMLPWQIPAYALISGRTILFGSGIPGLFGVNGLGNVLTWWLQVHFLAIANQVIISAENRV